MNKTEIKHAFQKYISS